MNMITNNINVENKEDVQTVNARELWEALEVQSEFKDWIIRRIEKYKFIEGQDFCSFLSESSGGRPAKEYNISISMAKELCMIENNEKGRLIRQYFIQVEEKWNLPEVVIARALILSKKQIEEWEPKVFMYEQFISAENTHSMNSVAKLFGMGHYIFMELLRDNKILMNNNVPYEKYMDYFNVKCCQVLINGNIVNKMVSYVKPKGIEFLANKLNLIKYV